LEENMKTRFLSFFIGVLMIMAIFGIPSTAMANTAWDGSTRDISWYTNNTSAVYYTINTGAQLAGLAQLVNEGNDFTGKTVALTQDVDLGSHNWTPIGTNAHRFNGTFDGSGNDIAGLWIGTSGSPDATLEVLGLFGNAGANAEIKNTGVDAAIYSSKNNACAGGIAGANSSMIVNCHVSGTISAGTGWTSAGGIVGCTYSNAIENSYATAAVSGFEAGGIVGWAYGGAMKNCYAAGTVTTGTAPGTSVSGDAGGLIGCIQNNNFIIINCYWNTNAMATAVGLGTSSYTYNMAGLSEAVMKGTDTSSITYIISPTNMNSNAKTPNGDPYPFLTALNGGRSVIPSIADGTPVEKWIASSGGYPIFAATLAAPVSVKVVSASYNSIQITWNNVPGASGYEICRANSKTGAYTKVYTAISGSTVVCKNTSLTTGKTYYYKIRAYRTVSGKKVYSSYSAVKSAKPVPAAPSITVKPVSSTSIKISWKKVSGASGYEVCRANSKAGSYKKVTSINKGTTLNYTNKSLTKGKTYYYKIRAYRTVSGKKVYGSYSPVVSGKT
jgi:hypothetical protein